MDRRFDRSPGRGSVAGYGRLSYEKSRLIAWHADDATVDELIDVAQGMTCIALSAQARG